MARQKLSKEDLKARQEQLKNETITDRTSRVLNPRINRLRKDIKTMTKAINSPRYYLGDVKKEKMVEVLTKDFDALMNAIVGSTSDEEMKDIL